MNYSLIDFVVAFEKWEIGIRTNRNFYRTDEEVEAMGTHELAKEKADYFLSLLDSKEQVTVH